MQTTSLRGAHAKRRMLAKARAQHRPCMTASLRTCSVFLQVLRAMATHFIGRCRNSFPFDGSFVGRCSFALCPARFVSVSYSFHDMRHIRPSTSGKTAHVSFIGYQIGASPRIAARYRQINRRTRLIQTIERLLRYVLVKCRIRTTCCASSCAVATILWPT